MIYGNSIGWMVKPLVNIPPLWISTSCLNTLRKSPDVERHNSEWKRNCHENQPIFKNEKLSWKAIRAVVIHKKRSRRSSCNALAEQKRGSKWWLPTNITVVGRYTNIMIVNTLTAAASWVVFLASSGICEFSSPASLPRSSSEWPLPRAIKLDTWTGCQLLKLLKKAKLSIQADRYLPALKQPNCWVYEPVKLPQLLLESVVDLIFTFPNWCIYFRI